MYVLQRIQSGLLDDGLSSVLAALATALFTTAFAAMHVIVSPTRSTMRQSHLAAAGWLLLLSIFAMDQALVTANLNCMLGGMLTYLFSV